MKWERRVLEHGSIERWSLTLPECRARIDVELHAEVTLFAYLLFPEAPTLSNVEVPRQFLGSWKVTPDGPSPTTSWAQDEALVRATSVLNGLALNAARWSREANAMLEALLAEKAKR